MNLTKKQIKQRHFDKIYRMAKTIECGCGCGIKLKDKDRYGRGKFFINGHNSRKYEDPIQHKREWNHRNQTNRYKIKIDRGRRLKGKIVIMMGGKCQDCGLTYNGKNGCVFQSHHTKPSEKEIVVNIRTLTTYSWEKMSKEIKKCIILCANCHFIRHNERY